MKLTLLACLLIPATVFGYQGSSVDDVWSEITKKPYKELTQKKVTLKSFFSYAKENLLAKSANRTVETKEDIIPYFNKLLHPNGICLRGKWNITKSNPYTGYFKKGSEAYIISRASTTISNTKRGKFRGFGLAGKIFPTLDTDEKVKTANFFQIDNLIGTYAKRYSDVTLTNEPELAPPISLGVVALTRIGLAVNKALSSADSNPGLRQVYSISELGLQANDKVNTPKYLATSIDSSQVKSDRKDFRDELIDHMAMNGDIRFNIKVSEDKKNWKSIGYISFDDIISSEACDHRLHFHHHKAK